MFIAYRQAFSDRVNYAARFIASGREGNRAFWGCFECYDGDAVVLALCRRAEKNERLRQALPQYISDTSIRDVPAKYAGRRPVDVSRECLKMAMADCAARYGDEYAKKLFSPAA